MSSDAVSNEWSSRGSTIIAIVGTVTGVSALFVAARLFVRIKLLRNLGLDDHLIVLAMVWLSLHPRLNDTRDTANNDQDLRLLESRNLQRRSEIRQWTAL